MAHPIPHRFLAVEGNIGAGKTTLCKMLERDYNCRLILEQFTDNPFLPFFYENPERYAFPVELFFMTERHKQLQEHLAQGGDLFQEMIVSDYFFIKTLLFARNNLNTEEYRLFQRLFHILNASFPKPDLLVYLHRPVDDLLRNIRHRGRAYEQDIRPDYLESIQQAYFSFFRYSPELPILILEVEQVSFWHDEAAYGEILRQIGQTYEPGVHRKVIG
ncbi:MAG: deoxynucleoside kinase [Saprospiraceae bacterium]|nr:deoxynucleoside kinase [Saprospiraceae bacterium]MCB0675332.1 deoxynucleoside kinase [Saprospiraceae bacterium]